MWLKKEIEQIHSKVYKTLEEESVEDILLPIDIEAIKRTGGNAIENIRNHIFQPKVIISNRSMLYFMHF